MDFLAEKVHFAAACIVGFEEAEKLLEMRGQAGDFFTDIGTVREECDLFEHTLVRWVQLQVELFEALE